MFAALALAWTAAAAAAAAVPPPPQTDEHAPAAYTAAQADRGRDEYNTWCANCHRSDLLGDERAEVPSLAEDSFFVRWGGRPLTRLFDMISKDMPADKPGRLPAQAYLDIVAYILQANGYPAGSQELRADPEVLKKIVIEKQ